MRLLRGRRRLPPDQPEVVPAGSPAWRVVGASVGGTSHQQSGQPCQDAHCWQVGSDGVLIAAVADGAGSATFGEVGADIAARTAVAAFNSQINPKGNLWLNDKGLRSQLVKALKAAQRAVRVEAAARQVELQELATTLILLVATPRLVAAAQVGDGAAIAGDSSGNIIGLTVPQTGQHINETVFLTARGALGAAQVRVWRGPVAHVAALSDGLQLLCLQMPQGRPHTPFFAPLFDFVAKAVDAGKAQEQLEAFLGSSRIADKTTDDLTLLIGALVG